MATCGQLKCPYMEICSLKNYRSLDGTNFVMVKNYALIPKNYTAGYAIFIHKGLH